MQIQVRSQAAKPRNLADRSWCAARFSSATSLSCIVVRCTCDGRGFKFFRIVRHKLFGPRSYLGSVFPSLNRTGRLLSTAFGTRRAEKLGNATTLQLVLRSTERVGVAYSQFGLVDGLRWD